MLLNSVVKAICVGTGNEKDKRRHIIELVKKMKMEVFDKLLVQKDKKEDEEKKPHLRSIWKFIVAPILGVLGIYVLLHYPYPEEASTIESLRFMILGIIVFSLGFVSLPYGIFGLLDELVWKPAETTKRFHYSLAKEKRWGELKKIGKSAVKSLILCLKDEDEDVRENAAWALGEIGDIKAIKPLWSSYTMLPVVTVTQVFINMGTPAVDQLIKVLKTSYEEQNPVVWALCEIGDRKATEAIVDWIFRVGPGVVFWYVDQPIALYEGKPISSADIIRMGFPPGVLAKLLGGYADFIFDIFAWRPTTDLEKFDLSGCNEAIRRLCKIRTPISSNILHKVGQINRLALSLQAWDRGPYTVKYLDFKTQRQMAKEELKRRGNPRYDPSVYLNQDA